jgi:branched-chain amino acid aminotransferase
MTSRWAPHVWIDGAILPREKGAVSVFDRGFQHGDGVYETVRACAGRLFRWASHRARLERSLAAARIDLPFPIAEIEQGIARCLEANALPDARVRIQITRGEGGPGIGVESGPGRPLAVVIASAFRPLPPPTYREGVAAIVSRIRQTAQGSLDPALKSTSRIHLVLARLEALEKGAHEALLLNGREEVAEGTSANVFLVRDGGLATPSLETGILEGVTREAVLELARKAGIRCEEARIPREDLTRAEEIFFTNTSWGVLPVTLLDGRKVGGGSPGPLASRLHPMLEDLVEAECAG